MDFEKLQNDFPQHEFFVVAELPAMFLIDLENNGTVEKSKNVKYFIYNSEEKICVEDFSKKIIEYNPDVAIPISFWVNPFDWLSIKDSMIADCLQTNGIKTFCNSTLTSQICFDKNFTNQKLNELISNKKIGNLKIPKSVYVHHELFWTERNKNEIKENVYKELIFLQIKKLNFPVIIKDTCGVSSYGMEVATTYSQVISFLNSKRNNSDRIIQEYIDGIHFGTEIFSYKNSQEEDKHFIMSPFIFSTNKYGITSPKQSVKLGPINNSIFKIDELKNSLLQLANEFNFCGITQVDLIFKNDFWYLLEINPRLSGMSKLYSVLSEKSLMQIFINLIEENFIQEEFFKNNFAINFKIPLLQKNQFDELSKNPNVKYLNQMENLIAKQEREKGFCQVVLSSKKSFEELKILFDEFIQENERFIDKDLLQGAFDLFNFFKNK
ncbi:MAG: ATP-grasp domain-containing protein [Treponemataceae bacterium]|nr:ATP-grasp domain-containing protein [Treponemataceae bacterium]